MNLFMDDKIIYNSQVGLYYHNTSKESQNEQRDTLQDIP